MRDKELTELRGGRRGRDSDGIDVRGHRAPAEAHEAGVGDGSLDEAHDRGAGFRIDRQEDEAGAIGACGRQREADAGPEEGVGHLDEDAGAVARVRVGPCCAAMLEIDEQGEGLLHQRVAAPAGEVGDKAHAAGIVLGARIVEALSVWRTGSGVHETSGDQCRAGAGTLTGVTASWSHSPVRMR